MIASGSPAAVRFVVAEIPFAGAALPGMVAVLPAAEGDACGDGSSPVLFVAPPEGSVKTASPSPGTCARGFPAGPMGCVGSGPAVGTTAGGSGAGSDGGVPRGSSTGAWAAGPSVVSRVRHPDVARSARETRGIAAAARESATSGRGVMRMSFLSVLPFRRHLMPRLRDAARKKDAGLPSTRLKGTPSSPILPE